MKSLQHHFLTDGDTTIAGRGIDPLVGLMSLRRGALEVAAAARTDDEIRQADVVVGIARCGLGLLGVAVAADVIMGKGMPSRVVTKLGRVEQDAGYHDRLEPDDGDWS